MELKLRDSRDPASGSRRSMVPAAGAGAAMWAQLLTAKFGCCIMNRYPRGIGRRSSEGMMKLCLAAPVPPSA